MPDTETVTARYREKLTSLGGAAVYEGLGKQGALPPGIHPLWSPLTLAGPALTVQARAGDNLALHRAVATASADVVIVAATGPTGTAPIWGDVLSTISQAKGVLGFVTDGFVRDSDRIRELNFPVFCRGTGLYGATKEFAGTVGEPITLDGVPVATGDWILADGDGILVIPADSVTAAITAGEAVEQRERELIRRAKLGESTLQQLGISSELVGP